MPNMTGRPGVPDNGNECRKFSAVPRFHPLRSPYVVLCLIGVETEGVLDYQGRAVESSSGHIRCRVLKTWKRCDFLSRAPKKSQRFLCDFLAICQRFLQNILRDCTLRFENAAIFLRLRFFWDAKGTRRAVWIQGLRQVCLFLVLGMLESQNFEELQSYFNPGDPYPQTSLTPTRF